MSTEATAPESTEQELAPAQAPVETIADTKRGSKKTSARKNVVKKPAAKKPSTKKSAVKKPAAKKPVKKKSAAKKSAVKKKAAKKAVKKTSVVKKTAAKKSVAKKSASKKRATKKSSAKKHVAATKSVVKKPTHKKRQTKRAEPQAPAISKAQSIRETAKELGKQVRPKDIIAALAAKGIEVSHALVGSTLKAAGLRRRRRPQKAIARIFAPTPAANGQSFIVNELVKVKKLAVELGGTAKLKELAAALEQLM